MAMPAGMSRNGAGASTLVQAALALIGDDELLIPLLRRGLLTVRRNDAISKVRVLINVELPGA